MNRESSNFFRLSIRPCFLLTAPLTAAGVVAYSATLFGFLGWFSWFLDLFSRFRVQYLIGLAILGTILLVVHCHKTAAAFLGFACVNLVLVLPLYVGSSSAPLSKYE